MSGASAIKGCGTALVTPFRPDGGLDREALVSLFCRACLQGRWNEARAWNRKLYPLMKINFIESSPIPVKAALAMMGRISEVYRLPLVKIGDDARARLARTLTDLQVLAQ